MNVEKIKQHSEYPFNLYYDIAVKDDIYYEIIHERTEIELVRDVVLTIEHVFKEPYQLKVLDILEKRYKDKLSYKQIANQYSISSVRIRQIIMQALRRMRNPLQNVLIGIHDVDDIILYKRYQELKTDLKKNTDLFVELSEAFSKKKIFLSSG